MKKIILGLALLTALPSFAGTQPRDFGPDVEDVFSDYKKNGCQRRQENCNFPTIEEIEVLKSSFLKDRDARAVYFDKEIKVIRAIETSTTPKATKSQIRSVSELTLEIILPVFPIITFLAVAKPLENFSRVTLS